MFFPCFVSIYFMSMCKIFSSSVHRGQLSQSSPHIKFLPFLNSRPNARYLVPLVHVKVQWNLRFYFPHIISPKMTSRTSAISFPLIHLYLNVITYSLSNREYWYYISFLSTSPNKSQPYLFALRKGPGKFNKWHIELWKCPWLSASYLRIT